MEQTITPLPGSAQPVLDIRDYSLSYQTDAGPVEALKSINLTVPQGQTLGLVGESGSGKSSLAWAIMRYLPANATEPGGQICLNGEDLRQKTLPQILEIRGRRIAMVFQDPSTSLNPTMRLGEQLAETLMRHRNLDHDQAWAEGEAALTRTGIARPRQLMQRFPHQASGGEKQRVVIATAFACAPELIIFDEPTTALDIITARQILDLFTELRAETGVAALYISHDLGLVSRIAQSVAVIQKGEIVEQGPCEEMFRAPRAAYTRALLAAVPRPGDWQGATPPEPGAAPLLSTDTVSVEYGRPSAFARLIGTKAEGVFGAKTVNLAVRPGELLGIVGESGSGKSTMAKVLSGLQDFDGTVTFHDRHFTTRRQIDTAYRRRVQMVFQHPDGSLNPRQRIREILSRPLKLYDLVPKADRAARIADLLEQVLLPADFANRYPYQLSGGEKQRVAIARAFAAEPDVVICDEITASLDVSVQASVAKLLIRLQKQTGTACIFITHDINLVRQLAHQIMVMYRGEVVDRFATSEATTPDRHSYTRDLLDAVPVPRGAAPDFDEVKP
ncbi:ABC transporter ATP-binding protein [Rhodophyticola sp. CCM32]|uniref:nickel ABC transporter ATP-binding protein NikE n=1 Tax=Rhodophyticola sp. CCM32 TaxID=2916397 RepID=UPI00107F7D77|nr:ABC transporter ATP-binding protein [Rhodophyticola sp. CCM32]QBY01350.1 ABC transporter ATP-binding protein [Rhodophyticola sp. CCM32]